MINLQLCDQLNNKAVVLASASPRRRELLHQIGLKSFKVVPSTFDETIRKEGYTGAGYAVETSKQKGLDVARKVELNADLIISADTVVECDDIILEKPSDRDDAFRMLKMLSGRMHSVHTGCTLIVPNAKSAVCTYSETTHVYFDNLSDATILEYIESGEPFGKAGSYGIQGMAAAFVSRVDGCYCNVVGFPLNAFIKKVEQLKQNGYL